MLKFDYFSATDADQYTFYRIPKILFTDKHFHNLSCEAKVLYGLMLDRISLSIKNKWFDKDGHAYIIFRSNEISELMGCGKQKAYRMLAELDSDGGIGLIERCRRGLGMANIIYVKNFNSANYGAGMNPNMPEINKCNKKEELPDNYHEEDSDNTTEERSGNIGICWRDTDAKGSCQYESGDILFNTDKDSMGTSRALYDQQESDCINRSGGEKNDQHGAADSDDRERTNLTDGYFSENGGYGNKGIHEDIQKYEIHTSGSMKSDTNEPADIQKDEIHTSGNMNFIHPEVPKSYGKMFFRRKFIKKSIL